MSDLISRNGLIIRLRNGSVIPFSKMLLNEKHKQILEFEDMIKTQPTAYDLEKVIQWLEEIISSYESCVETAIKEIDKNPQNVSTFEMCSLHNNRGYLNGLKRALEIVKSGGIDEGKKGGV